MSLLLLPNINMIVYMSIVIALCLYRIPSSHSFSSCRISVTPLSLPTAHAAVQSKSHMRVLRRGQGITSSRTSSRATTMQLLLFPQIVFASAAAFAVFYYVATNIEEIKAKQKVEIGTQSDAATALDCTHLCTEGNYFIALYTSL